VQVPEVPERAEPEYAERVALRRPRRTVRPWGGRGRRALRAACAALALALAAVTVAAVARQQPGADSPEAAVEQLVQGIADLDAPAIVGVVAPSEVADPERVAEAYDRLGERVLRVGEVPPAEVDRVLRAAEEQLGGAFSREALAVLAAVDLDLDGLTLEAERLADGSVRVYVVDGVLGVAVDLARLPDGAVVEGDPDGPDGRGESGAARYDMALAEGWERDGQRFAAYLVTTQVDGRWFVSLEASADDLLGLLGPR
jgi:hypothetical protein